MLGVSPTAAATLMEARFVDDLLADRVSLFLYDSPCRDRSC
jgi:hypothetical protein